MAKDVDYNSLREKYDTLEKEILPKRNNFRSDIKNMIRQSHQEYNTLHSLDSSMLNGLRNIVYFANEGEFDRVKKTGEYIHRNLNDIGEENGSKKYLEALSKRLDRASNLAMKYLEKNKGNITRKKLNEIKELLDYSGNVKNEAEGEKVSSSGLEKTLGIVSIGAVLAGIFLLSPNLTGNVVGTFTRGTSNIFGGLLFILGILGTFLTLKK